MNVRASPVGGTPLYQLAGPEGQFKVLREDDLIKNFALDKAPNPTSMPLQRPKHHLRNPDDYPDIDESTFTRNETVPEGGALSDEFKKYIDEAAQERVRDAPWQRQFENPATLHRLPAEPPKPPDPLGPGMTTTPTLPPDPDAPGIQDEEPPPLPEPRVPGSLPVVPETTLLSDRDTQPQQKSIPYPETPNKLYKQPSEFKHPPNFRDKPKLQSPAGTLQWSQHEDGVLVAPGYQRGIYMVRPDASDPKQVMLYFKVRGVSPLEELGTFPAPKALAMAQKHYQVELREGVLREMQQLRAEGIPEANIRTRIMREYPEVAADLLKQPKQGATSLSWHEVEPDVEWEGAASQGIRYNVRLEDQQFVLTLGHRRWMTPGPVIDVYQTLDEAVDAADQDHKTQAYEQHMTLQASSVTPQMVLAEVALMRDAEIPEIDIREMVMRHYPEVANEVLGAS